MNRKPLLIAILCAVASLQACKPESDSAASKTGITIPPASLSFFALDVGNTVNADQSAPPLTMFMPEDKIIASVRTKGDGKEVPVAARLIAMANGQAVGEQSKIITTSGPATTNFEFPKSGVWPMGRYVVEVTLNGKLEGRQEIEVREDVPGRTAEPASKQQ